MTTVQLKLTIPDQLAKQARAAGLLKSAAIESMLRERLKKQAGEELRVMMDKLASAKIPPMTEDEAEKLRDRPRFPRAVRKGTRSDVTTVRLKRE